MGKIMECYLMPHPPIAIPEIGANEQKKCLKTSYGMESIGERISELTPDTIIIITPHGPVFQDAICISTNKNLYGSFEKFNHAELAFDFKNNIDLVEEIIREVNKEGIFVGELNKSFAKQYNVEYDIDHGCLVPLYYINKKYKDYMLVHIVMGLLPKEELYKVGMAINKAIEKSDSNAVVIASGDLSHRLTHDAPAGFNKKGQMFDSEIIENIKNKDVEKLFDIEEEFLSQAGECGYRPLLILFGCLDGYSFNTSILSYEGPFGVGYCNGVFSDITKDNSKSKLEIFLGKRLKIINELRDNEDPYVSLARLALENYVKYNEKIDLPLNLPVEILENKAGVFVSLKKYGQLRGCIGTIKSTQKNIGYEIINNAISAGLKDPRFDPVEEYELDELVYSVDILGDAEDIDSIDYLDVLKYGVIVQSGYKKGLLLPNLEGVDTPEEQVEIALQKAGIDPNENFSMQRFQVIRHK
jgi:AmmeMemoRadiSam system protein A